MSFSIQRTALLLLASSAALSARAQDEEALEPLGIRFRLAGRVQFNLKASFTDAQTPLSGAAGRFADGYVLLGSNTSTSTNAGVVTANPGSSTWNWGYQRADQVAGNELTLTRYDQVPRVGALDGNGGNTTYGGEVWAMYELYSFRSFKKRTAHWGVEAGYGFTTFDASASGSVSGTATRRQSVYSLGGIVPPSPGYQGGYFGPVPGGPVSPVIDFAPVRSSSVQAAGINSLNAAVSTVAQHQVGALGRVADHRSTDRRFGSWLLRDLCPGRFTLHRVHDFHRKPGGVRGGHAKSVGQRLARGLASGNVCPSRGGFCHHAEVVGLCRR